MKELIEQPWHHQRIELPSAWQVALLTHVTHITSAGVPASDITTAPKVAKFSLDEALFRRATAIAVENFFDLIIDDAKIARCGVFSVWRFMMDSRQKAAP